MVFKKQMLQAANTDLLNPLIPKAHSSEHQTLLFSLQIKPVWTPIKASLRIFIFCTLGTNGLKWKSRGLLTIRVL